VGTCREDDAPAPARAHRGTTSLAVSPWWTRRPLMAGCDGPDPPGSTGALASGAASFLPGAPRWWPDHRPTLS